VKEFLRLPRLSFTAKGSVMASRMCKLSKPQPGRSCRAKRNFLPGIQHELSVKWSSVLRLPLPPFNVTIRSPPAKRGFFFPSRGFTMDFVNEDVAGGHEFPSLSDSKSPFSTKMLKLADDTAPSSTSWPVVRSTSST